MSRAIECDACHVCFNPLNMTDGKEMVSIKQLFYQNAEDYKEGRFTNYMYDVNLCPKCTIMFKKLMSNRILIDATIQPTEVYSDTHIIYTQNDRIRNQSNTGNGGTRNNYSEHNEE